MGRCEARIALPILHDRYKLGSTSSSTWAGRRRLARSVSEPRPTTHQPGPLTREWRRWTTEGRRLCPSSPTMVQTRGPVRLTVHIYYCMHQYLFGAVRGLLLYRHTANWSKYYQFSARAALTLILIRLPVAHSVLRIGLFVQASRIGRNPTLASCQPPCDLFGDPDHPVDRPLTAVQVLQAQENV